MKELLIGPTRQNMMALGQACVADTAEMLTSGPAAKALSDLRCSFVNASLHPTFWSVPCPKVLLRECLTASDCLVCSLP
jgi:hypothetical protein